MATSKKNVNQATAAAPAARKGKGKTVKVTEPTDRQPNYPTSISLMLKILIQTSHRHGGCRSPNLNPNSIVSNSFKSFHPANADGGPANRDDLTARVN